jgi:multidrug efflux pump subunit AcrA (membrane-fusion protein)
MLDYIKEDQRSEILSRSLPYGSVEAPVSRISPFLHPVSHSTIAEIDLPNPDKSLKPGMFVSVDIFYGESEQATLVPLSALWENPSTGVVGVFTTRDSLTHEPVANLDDQRGGSLTEPVPFDFVPVDVIAKGRMNAGVRGIEPGSWIVTIGQDLLGSDSARARVRPVKWEWVEELQKLQREDLLEETMRRQQTGAPDTSMIGSGPERREGSA